MGESKDCIGGFVGDSFYESGYVIDFYREALANVEQAHPLYCEKLVYHATKVANGFKGL
jgi:predicted SnoaL-like aldol condensation-catalyzing enzyme